MIRMLTNPIASDRWERFLNRPPLSVDRASAAASLQGKRILVTGAGGSIGSALTIALAEFAPQSLVLIEASEQNLYAIQTILAAQSPPVEPVALLGNISDPVLLEEAFRQYQPQIVFHAAALKHVPLMEQNPFAAIQNNALATDLLYRMAASHRAEQFILLSTDKAVDPTSIMGASKRIAELILLAPRPSATHAKAVRLGNVLGSEGSIVPLFLRQIAAGTPVTVTHPDMRRYFLTVDDAVALLLHAACCTARNGLLVPHLGEPLMITALARYLFTLASSAASAETVVFTRLRPGDKMCESLLSGRESYVDPGSRDLLRTVTGPPLAAGLLEELLPELVNACGGRSLQRLLAAVQRLVPEYQPSTLLTARRGPV